ncbi:MAG TPA: hypothetical protein VNF68_11760 [Candidatus Baltobacteraceae bacterium]|nr:hypothetical protein [Candidatus Baltobacteraceae bacterium]
MHFTRVTVNLHPIDPHTELLGDNLRERRFPALTVWGDADNHGQRAAGMTRTLPNPSRRRATL